MKKKSSPRLTQIRELIERIECRAMAVDGPINNTRDEMTDDELRDIYRLAGGKPHRTKRFKPTFAAFTRQVKQMFRFLDTEVHWELSDYYDLYCKRFPKGPS